MSFIGKNKKNITIMVLVLIGLQLLVILGSWLYSAALPDSSVRPILSDSGIRWFFGTFIANLSSPFLVYIILLDLAIGSCVRSGLWQCLKNFRKSYSSLVAPFVVVLFEVFVILLLTLPRHAILLSATGGLFPSSFSTSIVPIIAFMLLSAAVSFGLFSGKIHNFQEAIVCCVSGGANLKLIIAVYVLAMELWKMTIYVINI